MNCHECARDGSEQPAGAICLNCGVGMCMQHLDEERARNGPGGTRSAADTASHRLDNNIARGSRPHHEQSRFSPEPRLNR